jgi:hypothetical protein
MLSSGATLAVSFDRGRAPLALEPVRPSTNADASRLGLLRRTRGSALARPTAHRRRLDCATGTTLAELMARLGHSTQGAALRYQDAARNRDAEIARRLSQLAGIT